MKSAITFDQLKTAAEAQLRHPKSYGKGGLRCRCMVCEDNRSFTITPTTNRKGEPGWTAKCLRGCDPMAGGNRLSIGKWMSGSNGNALIWPDGDENHNGWTSTPKVNRKPTTARTEPVESSSAVDWQAESKKCLGKLSTNQLDALASATGVPRKGWESIGTGWANRDDLRRWKAGWAGEHNDYPQGAYTIPERNGAGEIIGLALRAVDGRKGAPSGGKRGLTIPVNRIDDGATIVVEGGSDVAAGVVLGVDAIGRPSATSGADDLATLLTGCEEVIVMGENDGGVGLTGAESIARKLSNKWGKPVRWVLPPDGVKDLRGLLQRLVAEGLDLGDADAVRGVREIILADLQERAEVVEPDKGESITRFRKRFTIYTPSTLPGPEKTDWLLDGFIPKGGIVLLAGSPKGGKSTFTRLMLRACGEGGGFIGRYIHPMRVLIVSEESSGIWKSKTAEMGIGDHIGIMPRPFTMKPGMNDFVELIDCLCEEVRLNGYELVVFDTLSHLLPCRDENDSATMETALAPIRAISEVGASVLLIHHTRKSGGEHGEGVRGSTAITAFTDINITLSRMQGGGGEDTRRVLKADSRYDETPHEIIIEKRGDEYVEVGSVNEVANADKMETIADILLTAGEDGLTRDEIRKAWPDEGAPARPGDSTLRGLLNDGAKAIPPKWERIDSKKPYRFHLAHAQPLGNGFLRAHRNADSEPESTIGARGARGAPCLQTYESGSCESDAGHKPVDGDDSEPGGVDDEAAEWLQEGGYCE